MNGVKEHFAEYNELCQIIEEKEFQLIMMKEALYSVRGVSYDDMPKGGGGGADIVRRIQSIDELQDELNEMRDERRSMQKKLSDEIMRLKNPKHRTVMRAYYLMRSSGKEIMRLMNLSESRVYTLKREAEKEFAEKALQQ